MSSLSYSASPNIAVTVQTELDDLVESSILYAGSVRYVDGTNGDDNFVIEV